MFKDLYFSPLPSSPLSGLNHLKPGIKNPNLNSNVKNTQNLNPSEETGNATLGYRVDKDGYFTNEFNRAAGIPEDIKIHSSTMESLVRVQTDPDDVLRIFRSLDIAKTAGNAYKILSQVVGENVLYSKDSFSLDEIAKFPQGYKYNIQTMQVSEIYNDIDLFHRKAIDFFRDIPMDGREDRMSLDPLFFNNSWSKPATDIFNNTNGGPGKFWFDTTKSKYTNPDGTITRGGLLVAVINANLYTREGEASANGKVQGFDKSMSYKDIQNYNPADDPNAEGEFLLSRSMTLGISKEDYNAAHSDDETFRTYKDPITLMLEDIEKLRKEQLERLKRQGEERRLAKQRKKLDIKA